MRSSARFVRFHAEESDERTDNTMNADIDMDVNDNMTLTNDLDGSRSKFKMCWIRQ